MRLWLLLAASPVAALAVAACENEPPPDRYDTAGSDSGAPDLPEAAAPVDAGPPVDARPPFDPKDEPVTCKATPCATQLVAGDDHFCVRKSDGTVRCWGDDAFGAVGDTSALSGVSQVSAGGGTTCARLDDGKVVCWGKNESGELGLTADPPTFDADPHPQPSPVALDALGPASRVDVGHGSACAVLASGKLACWGRDHRSQLSRVPYDQYELEPFRGPGLAGIGALPVARALVGSATALALTPSGEVWSWGALAGEDGVVSGRVASVSPDGRPARIASLEKVTSLAVSGTVVVEVEPEPGPIPGPDPEPPPPRAHACAITNGNIHCWGSSYVGALCTGLPDREQAPRYAPTATKYWPQQVAVSDEITCARMTDGQVQCCGKGTSGQLGTGTVALFSAFFAPATAFKGHAVQVATSRTTVCALVQGGTVECWGGNAHGELGITPDDKPHPSPVKVAF